MIRRFIVVAFIAGWCLAEDTARMDQVVQAYANDHQFMGTALVGRGDEVVFSKAYGFANLEWDVPNTPNTKYRLGSITKQFTAALILKLQESGKLSVHEPVKKYMPDAPAAWDKVTVEYVLTHTSGIPSFTDFPEYPKLEPFPTTAEKLVALFRDKPLDFEPGSKWSYSNSGYVLLSYLVEKLNGEKYEKIVRDQIFTPLGMKDSGYDSNTAVIPHRASGYTRNSKGEFENAGFIHMTVPQGAGALYSTTEDLFKWEQGLFGGKVLKPESLAQMTTPFKGNYGFGLMIHDAHGRKVIEHGGGIEGFNTELAYYPADKLTVVVLGNVNGQAPGRIADTLAEVAHGKTVTLPGERKETTLEPQVLSRYVGAYRMDGPGNLTLLVTIEGSQLSAKLGNQPAFPIYAEAKDQFFLKVVDAQLVFSKNDPPGDVTLHQNGRELKGKRLDPAETKKATDAAAAFTKRFKDQTAAEGSEAAVRRLIGEIQTGKPNYDLMTESFAATTRQQLSQLQTTVQELGDLKSLKFKGVGPGGADIYEVTFAKGALDLRIWMADAAKVENAVMRKM